MTKLDHEKLNRLKKAEVKESHPSVAATPEMKTLRSGKRPSISTKSPDTKIPDPSVLCEHCHAKVLPKNMGRHYYFCHQRMKCPLCFYPFDGKKRLGRHIKKQHGHRAFKKFKKGTLVSG